MTTGRLPSRYGLLLVFVPTVVVLTLLCGAIGYSLEASHADDIVDHNNDHLLRRSLDIANEQIATIVELSAPAESCSDEDLARMRARLFKSRYAGDIARISDGALRCSAVWGEPVAALIAGRVLGRSMRSARAPNATGATWNS